MVAGLLWVMSPAIETSPLVDRAAGRDRRIVAELRGSRTGVIGQDAQPAAEREALHDIALDAAAGPRHDAVILIGVAHDEAVERAAFQVADGAVAVVDALALGAAVAAHRHPAGVDD